MIAVVPRISLAALAVCVFLPYAQAQGDGGFTTGPPSTGGETRIRFALDDIPSPPGGGDIRANPTTSAGQNETSLAVNPGQKRKEKTSPRSLTRYFPSRMGGML